MTASRWWASRNGMRTIDLAAVTQTKDTPAMDLPADRNFHAQHRERCLWLGLGADSAELIRDDIDSFFAALSAWREAQEGRPLGGLRPGELADLERALDAPIDGPGDIAWRLAVLSNLREIAAHFEAMEARKP